MPPGHDATRVTLRRTEPSDLEYVLAVERDPENTPYIGSWTRAEHGAAIDAADREHWIIECGGAPAGYLITIDQRAAGRGMHIKRIAVSSKSRGIGRAALEQYAHRAFEQLGAELVWLDVLTANARARAAYRAVGFEVRTLAPEELARWAASVGGFDDPSVIMTLTRAGDQADP